MLIPKTRPKLSRSALLAAIDRFELDRQKHPIVIVGVRGYYRDTMGKPGVNDRALYDDAIFIDAPEAFGSFNANTVPTQYRAGRGTREGEKGMATLKPGLWLAHRIGKHKKQYPALIQTGGPVTVSRDGTPPYDHTGYHGINIHCGGSRTTSSLGCQTLPPAQWTAFISCVVDQSRRCFGAKWNQTTIPYILLEGLA